MDKKMKQLPVSRRKFVGATVAGASVLMGLSVQRALAFAAEKSGMMNAASACSKRHAEIARKLTQTIADPLVDAEATALAIRTSSCTCCGTRIGPSVGFSAKGVAA